MRCSGAWSDIAIDISRKRVTHKHRLMIIKIKVFILIISNLSKKVN